MFCPKCGSELKGGQKFCGKCGASIGEATEKNQKPETVIKTEQVNEKKKINKVAIAGVALGILVVFGLFKDISKTVITAYKNTHPEMETEEIAAASSSGGSGSSSANSSSTKTDATNTSDKNEDEIEYVNGDIYHWTYPYNTNDDYIIFRGNHYFSEYLKYGLTHNRITFEDKTIDKLQMGDYESAIVTSEGKNYYVDDAAEGFFEIDERAVYPSLTDWNVTYVIPTSSDGQVGDLYYMYSVWPESPKVIAHDVVACTTGMTYDSDTKVFFFTKYVDGKYSLVRAECEKTENKEDEYDVTETVIREGYYIPIHKGYKCVYYYDPESKELFYQEDEGEATLLYTGNIDEYFIGDQMYIRDGSDLYAVDSNHVKTAEKVLENFDCFVGTDDIYDYGNYNGHEVRHVCVLKDKNGDEYVVSSGSNSNEHLHTIKLNFKVEDPDYTICDEHNDYVKSLHLLDGVLYVDTLYDDGSFDRVKNFDKEKVVSYSFTNDDRYVLVYTESGNIYLENKEDEKTDLVIEGVDKNKDGSDGNYTWDYEQGEIIYGKGGKFYSFDPYDSEVDEIMENHDYGYFTRDKFLTYFEYQDPENAENKSYYYHDHAINQIF